MYDNFILINDRVDMDLSSFNKAFKMIHKPSSIYVPYFCSGYNEH